MYISTFVAGWSSLVARKAHNLEVPGSNPGPATIPGVVQTPFFSTIATLNRPTNSCLVLRSFFATVFMSV